MNHLLYYSLSLYLALTSPTSTSAAASPKETALPEPCTIRSPNTHAFFDLNPLHVEDPRTSKAKQPKDTSWHATGWDLGYNFTLNFCGGVIEDLADLGGVEGVEKDLWRNVSAFYQQGGKVYSIGQQNSAPIFRGRKLVLNYTDGSQCDAADAKRAQLVERLTRREINDPDDEDDEKSSKKKPSKAKDDHDDGETDDKPKKETEKPPSSSVRRKHTIISFLCDKDPLSPQLTINFIGASPDECTYIFEARTSAACGGIETAKQTLSPSGVFGVIVLIAVMVYIVGGCVYSRVVLQQRGWRQLPNYSLWAALGRFFRDIFVILTSSCARFMPSRRGYQRVNGGLGGSGSGRGRGRGDSDAENRLIDELNEEWDD